MAMNYPYPTSSPTSQGAYTTGVRSALKQKGITDEQITYDPNKGVMIGGTPFIRPEKIYSGSSYTSPQGFQTAWDAYSKSLTQPTTGTTGVTPTGTTAGFMPTPTTPAVQPSPINEQINQIIQGLQNYGQTQPAFDPYSSAAYQAAQAQTQRQAQQGIRSAQEAYGSAGFGRSTALGERAQRIGQEGTEYLMTQVLPQIQAQEQTRRQQEFQNVLTSLQPLLGQQSRADELAQREITNRMQQAQLTGNLPISPEAQNYINQLMTTKRQAETAAAGGATPETMGQYQSQGDVLRSQLANMGIDISGLGAETAAADVRIPRGVQTLEARQLERRDFESDRQFEFAKGQQAWENNLKQAQFDINKAQQAWENTFKEKDFLQSMKEAAASRGLQWASLGQRDKEFVADQAFREKQFEFEKEQAGAKEQEKPTKVDAKKSADNYDLLYDDLQTENITKEQGRQLIESNRDFLSDSDYKKLKEWVNDNL